MVITSYLLAALGAALLLPFNVAASDASHAMHEHDRHGAHGEHAEHMKMLANTGEGYRLTTHEYSPPHLELLDANRSVTDLAELLGSDEPIVLSFIYTSCTTVCPVLSATLAEAQPQLQNSARPPRLVSISIDPTYDTPERLKAYADKYQAGSRWHFLTGDTDSIVQAQRAFGAYRGDKSNHIPLTFIRGPGEERWVRIEGFTSASDLVKEYERLTRL